MERYLVTRIEEMDHGCEGIPDGAEPEVYVYLKAEDGTERVLRHNDALLYERGIDEGDSVRIAEDRTLEKQ